MGKSKIVDAEAMALYDQKMDDVDMADALGVVPLTVKNWRKRNNLPSLVGPGNHKKAAASKEKPKPPSVCSSRIANGCEYWSVNGKCCDYYLMTGQRRPCPAGPGCTVRKGKPRHPTPYRPFILNPKKYRRPNHERA